MTVKVCQGECGVWLKGCRIHIAVAYHSVEERKAIDSDREMFMLIDILSPTEFKERDVSR